MNPITFDEANNILKAAPGTEDEVEDLPIYYGDTDIISCWSATWWERLQILFTGRVWFWIMGETHPPVSLQTYYPFVKRENC